MNLGNIFEQFMEGLKQVATPPSGKSVAGGSGISYYMTALQYKGVQYLSGGMSRAGVDCSGLVNLAAGQKTRVWDTNMNTSPPGNWMVAPVAKSSHDAFIFSLKQGDLLVWKGHCAFYAGNGQLFHARKPGTVVDFTSDLKVYWLPQKGYPTVYRQIF